MSLPQYTRSQRCINERITDISTARLWYQITDENKESKILFPFKQIPWLNQTIQNVIYHYSVDFFEGRYVSLFGTWKRVFALVYGGVYKAFIQNPFVDMQEYKLAYHAFQEGLKVCTSLNIRGYLSDFSDLNSICAGEGIWETFGIISEPHASNFQY